MGDGKTAIRGSWGIFYNFPRSTGDGGYPFSGGCPVSCTRQIRWSRFDDIQRATAANLIENPVNVNVAGYEQPLAKSHNFNLAFQRDIGFNTVVEVAYVGNFTWNHGRSVDVEPAAAVRVRQSEQPGEQRADQRQLAPRTGLRAIPRNGIGEPVLRGALQQDTSIQRSAAAGAAPTVERPADGRRLHARQRRGLPRLRPLH